MLTPFYFLNAGALVHIGSVWAGLSAIAMLLGVKMVAKFIGVCPATRFFKQDNKTSVYTTLLMSTGLTFGSISAMFGLNRGLISQWQYSVLVTTVIASAVIPTLIAQRHFRPAVPAISFESEDEAMVLTERVERANGADGSKQKSE